MSLNSSLSTLRYSGSVGDETNSLYSEVSETDEAITILKYDELEEDEVSNTLYSFGESPEDPTPTAYIAVKKQPFFITLQSSSTRHDVFLHCVVKISLRYYDCNRRTMSMDTVSFVHTFPFEYKTRAKEDGTEMEIETVIHSLSSQHQGSLFCLVIEVTDKSNQSTLAQILTAPFRVISKTDSLSVTMATAEGQKKTVSEVLTENLRAAEIKERETTKMLATLCGESIASPVLDPTRPQINLGTLVKMLCNEYRAVARSEREHRLQCEIAGLVEADMYLLNQVQDAFNTSFEAVFDANYEKLRMSR